MSHTEEIRFVTYQGTSPLPQLPWKLPWSGPLLVLSLFDGVGSLLLSLLALGATFAALAWETDSDAVYITRKTLRHLRHMGDVHSFDPACVEDLLVSHKFTAVLVAGGSPCQDVSLLKANRPGLQSARSLLFNSVPEFADQCRQVVKDLGLRIPVLTMLENVASQQPPSGGQGACAVSGAPMVPDQCRILLPQSFLRALFFRGMEDELAGQETLAPSNVLCWRLQAFVRCL